MSFRVVNAREEGGSVAAYTYASGGDMSSASAAREARIADEIIDQGQDTDALVAMPGQAVANSALYMRGHGCYLDASRDEIVSLLIGSVDRVNKLISVRPVRTRYRPEVGDLVIGRITEVQSKRWKVDIGSKTDASLQLSSINLPGGVQRKKLESDELQMRLFFQEGDLLVAEVQGVFQDGSVGLHTRSLRYGKLRNGTLAVVPPVLVRRHKSHFITLAQMPGNGVDVVLGLNGLIWVAKHIPFDVSKAEGEAEVSTEGAGRAGRGTAMDVDGVYSDVNMDIAPATRTSISIVTFVLAVMAQYGLPVAEDAIECGCNVVLRACDGRVPNAAAPESMALARKVALALHGP
ncbi:Exosome complex component rrp4 [Malassezia vespertilionis]|uniref:Rrp4p n=1 Tax=Malassezia vespertilionis TaxID=2020962 RepID=A0A2N1J813_9BASI|nr:Exosome complex component rrp4 [Malassezia vespertilionis]PKI82690.1 Rrp4p [Malassezia vespertilionis]WFD08457.1 Exosome complex component rrp4 [Malassezia vespertilionis]